MVFELSKLKMFKSCLLFIIDTLSTPPSDVILAFLDRMWPRLLVWIFRLQVWRLVWNYNLWWRIFGAMKLQSEGILTEICVICHLINKKYLHEGSKSESSTTLEAKSAVREKIVRNLLWILTRRVMLAVVENRFCTKIP